MNCKHASQVLSQSFERRLSLGERLGLRLHLLMCDACTQFARQVTLLRQAIQRLVTRIGHDQQLRLSEEARERIAKALNDQH